jgi:hypothetical protein
MLATCAASRRTRHRDSRPHKTLRRPRGNNLGTGRASSPAVELNPPMPKNYDVEKQGHYSAGRMRPLLSSPRKSKARPTPAPSRGMKQMPKANYKSKTVTMFSCVSMFPRRLSEVQSDRVYLSHHPLPQLLQRIPRPPPDDSVIPQRMKHGAQQGVDKQRRAHRMQQKVISWHARAQRHPQVN